MVRGMIAAFFALAAFSAFLGALAYDEPKDQPPNVGIDRFTFTQEGIPDTRPVNRKYWVEIDDLNGERYEFRFEDAFLDTGDVTLEDIDHKLTGDCNEYISSTPNIVVDDVIDVPVVKLQVRGADAQCVAKGDYVEVGSVRITGSDAGDSQVVFSRVTPPFDEPDKIDTLWDEVFFGLMGAFLGVTLTALVGYKLP